MELTHELRENAGLQWVLERLSPLSPFGKQAARTPRWYGPGEEAALEEELDNVALAMELWAAGGTAPQAAAHSCPPSPSSIPTTTTCPPCGWRRPSWRRPSA